VPEPPPHRYADMHPEGGHIGAKGPQADRGTLVRRTPRGFVTRRSAPTRSTDRSAARTIMVDTQLPPTRIPCRG
jgi:hypothetical protein